MLHLLNTHKHTQFSFSAPGLYNSSWRLDSLYKIASTLGMWSGPRPQKTIPWDAHHTLYKAGIPKVREARGHAISLPGGLAQAQPSSFESLHTELPVQRNKPQKENGQYPSPIHHPMETLKLRGQSQRLRSNLS